MATTPDTHTLYAQPCGDARHAHRDPTTGRYTRKEQ